MSQSTAQDQGYFERQNNEGVLFEDANNNFSFRENEEFDQYLSYQNQEPKNKTTCLVEQKSITLIGVMQEVCKKQEPEIIKTILELNENVNGLINQKSLMSKGNGVYKFIECLKNQEKSKQTLLETIMLEMRNILKQRIDFEMQMLYYNSSYMRKQNRLQKKIDLDFTDLNQKTIKHKKLCSQVHVFQKQIPQQIPSIIQRIVQSKNLKKNLLDSAREVEPFINECTCILRKQRVLKMKQLKQKLSSNQFQLFIDFIEILKKNTNLFIFDSQWDETEKVEILGKYIHGIKEKFKMNIKNAKEKRFPQVDAMNENNSSGINKNSKKIKKSK